MTLPTREELQELIFASLAEDGHESLVKFLGVLDLLELDAQGCPENLAAIEVARQIVRDALNSN